MRPLPICSSTLSGSGYLGAHRLETAARAARAAGCGERRRGKEYTDRMKLRSLCKSKIHHAVVTGADVNYIGSIGIDAGLMRLTDLVEGEQVAVWNVTNGKRLETYALALPEGSGQIVVNGAAAHHFTPGDIVIIVSYCLTDEVIAPRMIMVDRQNRFLRNLTGTALADNVPAATRD
jgi:aspartate 1-decarboxylase